MLTTASDVLARSGEAAKSGPIGFAVVLVLAVACYFLFKSMSKHMRTVREHFPTGDSPKPAAPAETTTVELTKIDPPADAPIDGPVDGPVEKAPPAP